jgi:hypothetical protein
MVGLMLMSMISGIISQMHYVITEKFLTVLKTARISPEDGDRI